MTLAPAPVVVFAYNRPSHLAKCLSALSEATLASETEVRVFSDGPRSESDKDRVDDVRRVLHSSDWMQCFRSYEIVEADSNLGLAESIISGITKILSEAESVIVLEDDLIVAPDFLSFMNDSLAYYQAHRVIGSVTGYCPLPRIPKEYPHDVMAVPRMCSHGWATWADRWVEVDWHARSAASVWKDPELRKLFNSAGSDQLYRLRRQLNGRIRTWAIVFNLWLITTGRLTIYPVQNKVRNIGFDGSGTHTRPTDKIHSAIAPHSDRYSLELPRVHPEIVEEFHRVYSGSLLGQIKRALINIGPPSSLS